MGIKTIIKKWLDIEQIGGSMDNATYNNKLENQLWYDGNEEELKNYYKSMSICDTKRSYFYATLNPIDRAVHSGLPSLISNTMSRLIFGNGKTVTSEDEKALERLNEILEDNHMNILEKEGSTFESVGGNVAYKLSFDTNISTFPIIELYRSHEFEPIFNRGRLISIIFIDKFIYNKNNYVREDIYTKGRIDYKLYIVKGSKRTEVPLSSTPETTDLMTLETGTNIIYAGYKPNMTFEGISDYEHIISEFDTLDETFSQYAEEIRDGATIKYFPEDKVPKNRDGKPILEIKNKRNFVMTQGKITDTEDNIQHIQNEIRATVYNEISSALTTNILSNVGLSIATIGIDTAGAGSSAEARRELEKASLRTRAERMDAWKNFLEGFYEIILQFQDILNKKTGAEYKFNVSFGDYIVDSFDDRVKNAKELTQANIIDTEKALSMVFEDMEDDEKHQILVNLGEALLDSPKTEDENGTNSVEDEEIEEIND